MKNSKIEELNTVEMEQVSGGFGQEFWNTIFTVGQTFLTQMVGMLGNFLAGRNTA